MEGRGSLSRDSGERTASHVSELREIVDSEEEEYLSEPELAEAFGKKVAKGEGG